MTWWSTFFSLSLCVASCFDTAIVTGILIISSWMMSSMSFSRQSDGHSLAHSLTHSILIKLFIKPGLYIFPLPPLLSIVFVKESSAHVWQVLGGTRKAYILVRYQGEPGYEVLEGSAISVSCVSLL